MTFKLSLLKLQQENDRLQSELAQLRKECDRLRQTEAKSRQTHLLSTVAQVSNFLLRSQDYTTVILDVVRLLGEAVGSDRCAFVQSTLDTNSGRILYRILAEWSNQFVLDSVTSSFEHDSVEDDYLVIEGDLLNLHRRLEQGEIVNYLADELPDMFRRLCELQGTTSGLVVPIFVQGIFWGHVYFDNCGEARLFDEAEIAVLKIAADSIAAAIERQAKDDELRRSEALYRSLFEISNEGIYRWELDQAISLNLPIKEQVKQFYQNYSIVQANDVFAEMYGLAKGDDASGMRLTTTHIAQSEKNQEFITAFVENRYRIQNAESEEIDVTERKRYFLNSGFGFIENDRVTGGWGTQIDITELRETQQALLQAEQERSQELERLNTELQQTLDRLSESEERYRILFELSNEGIYRFVFTPPFSTEISIDEQVELSYNNFRYAEVNQTFVEQYGLISSEQIVGKGVSDFWVEESQVGLESHRRIIENGYRLRGAESEETYADGTVRHFLWNVVCDVKDGYIWGGWGIQTDITELRLAQQVLLKAEQERVAELSKTNQALKNSLDRLAAEPDLDAFLGHVLIEISQQLDIYAASLHLYNPNCQTLHLNSWVEQHQVLPQQEFFKLGEYAEPILTTEESIWQLLLRTKFPFVITRRNAFEFMFPGTHDWQLQWADRHEIQAGINILLTLGDTPLGLLCLLSKNQSEFTSEELELAQALAQQATLAIQLTRLAEEAKQAAILDERNRLAREIHDTLAQAFAGIGMQLQAANRLYDDLSKAQTHLDRAQELAKRGLSEARRSVWVLCQEGNEYCDLSQTLPRLVEQMSAQTTVQINLNIQGTPYNLEPEVGMNLLRIAQESLNNALHHAHATTIAINLTYERDRIEIKVQDNGRGFEPELAVKGFGLMAMQQRADYIDAQLTISSQIGSGTEVWILTYSLT
jgi:PAS domain S-box-containing protein